MLRLVPNQGSPAGGVADVDEDQLFVRVKAGDMAAFAAFYKLYYPRLFRFIQRIVSHQPDTVEEVIQETLLVVWQKPESFNHSCKLSTWVFGIAYHKALQAVASHARHDHADVDLLPELADSTANPAQQSETEDWLRCALAILPQEQRLVLELTFYHGLPYQDIAIILNCPENTVKTRMFHARKKLQAFAKNQGN